MKYYAVIEIKLENGEMRYLRFPEHTHGVSVVKSKSQATRFDNTKVAEICSDYFWDQHWKSDEYSTREVIRVKAIGGAK